MNKKEKIKKIKKKLTEKLSSKQLDEILKTVQTERNPKDKPGGPGGI